MTGDCPECKEGTMYFESRNCYLTYPASYETKFVCRQCKHEITKYSVGKRIEDVTMKEYEGHWSDRENV